MISERFIDTLVNKKNMSDSPTKLTDKQEEYCQKYVICMNQSTAYRLAYDADSMNSNSVAREACLLHADPNISQRIKGLQAEAYERNKATIDELVSVLSGMVRFDIGDLYDKNNNLLNIKDMPVHARQMISQLDSDELYMSIGGQKEVVGTTKKVRTIQKLDAVEKLMKHFGGYEKDNFQKKPEANTSTIVFKKFKKENE